MIVRERGGSSIYNHDAWLTLMNKMKQNRSHQIYNSPRIKLHMFVV